MAPADAMKCGHNLLQGADAITGEMGSMLRALHLGSEGGAARTECSSSSSSEDDLESALRQSEAVQLHVRMRAQVACAWVPVAHTCQDKPWTGQGP